MSLCSHLSLLPLLSVALSLDCCAPPPPRLPQGSCYTLLQFLKAHASEIREEFNAFGDEENSELISAHLERGEAGKGATYISNIQASKLVDTKLKRVLMLLEDMHDLVRTEWILLGASLQRIASIKATELMDSFISVGHVKIMCTPETHMLFDASTEVIGKEVCKKCREMIQTGLRKLLKSLKHPHMGICINYPNFNKVFIYNLGIDLKGWPIPGLIHNPGLLSVFHCSVLLSALQENHCYWVKMPTDEWEQRVTDLDHHEANGKQVYNPRKPHTCKCRRIKEDDDDHDSAATANVDNTDADDKNEGEDEDVGNKGKDPHYRCNNVALSGMAPGSSSVASMNANNVAYGDFGMQFSGVGTYGPGYDAFHTFYDMNDVDYNIDNSDWGTGFDMSMASGMHLLDNDGLAFNYDQ
ncbi:hypothetical protein K488DRAFT_74711 [Vararia minispora EC-137]|uniref:Uncharacterized protein n=1 Tax=Vararia minispora EC-137 TaxID=1314806 RepID=A0ACB8Q6E2_9AGAM|nr:hypothetical protein K488DRAFT_74711 [Vararia minispora EC-137]